MAELTLRKCHGQNVPLEVALHDAPRALVDSKRRLVRHAGVRVRFRHYPCGRVGDAEVEHLALRDEVVQAVHHLLDAASVVPPVHVENVDVVRAQLLQRIFNRDVHRLEVVARVVRLLRDVILSTLVVRSVLCTRIASAPRPT